MNYLKICFGIITLCFVGACSDSNCIKCESEDPMFQDLVFCDESDITYTDNSGEIIEFSNLKEYYETQGYSCD